MTGGFLAANSVVVSLLSVNGGCDSDTVLDGLARTVSCGPGNV